MAGSEEIRVQATGLTVGWNLVVMLAAVVLGFYITTQVGPLQTEIKSLTEANSRLEKRVSELEAFRKTTEAHIIKDEQQQNFFDQRLKEMKAELQSGRVSHYTNGNGSVPH